MEYRESVTLKDGRVCLIRNGTRSDAAGLLESFVQTHGETENLFSYS